MNWLTKWFPGNAEARRTPAQRLRYLVQYCRQTRRTPAQRLRYLEQHCRRLSRLLAS